MFCLNLSNVFYCIVHSIVCATILGCFTRIMLKMGTSVTNFTPSDILAFKFLTHISMLTDKHPVVFKGNNVAMDLDEVFHYSVIIQRRAVVLPETTVFQTAANGGSSISVVHYMHLVSQKKSKSVAYSTSLILTNCCLIAGNLSLKPMRIPEEREFCFSLTTFPEPFISFFFFIVFHFKFMRLSIVSVVVVLVA